MTSDRDSLRRALDAVGSTTVPPPEAEFVDGLGLRLAAMAESRRAPSPTPRAVPRSGRVAVAALAGAAAVAAALTLAWLSGPGGTERVAVAFAVDTTVELPGGRVVPARSGLELPEGAVVRIGPGGRARVGGVTLRAGTEAVVRDGRLRVRHRSRVPPAGSDTPTTTRTVVTTTTVPAGAPTTRVVTTTIAPTTTSTRPATTTTVGRSTTTTRGR